MSMDQCVSTYDLYRYQDGQLTAFSDDIIVEISLELRLQGTAAAVLETVPQALEDLVVGHLYTSGLITGLEQVEALRIDEDLGVADVTLRSDASAPSKGRRLLDGDPCELAQVLAGAQQFLKRSELFARTGSAHSAELVCGGRSVAFCEDIGRFNALDKAVGKALRTGADLSRCTLYFSGRVPLAVCQKVIQAGIPVLVARSSPTDKAVELAREAGLTLIGFVRDHRMNVYSMPRNYA